MIIILNFAQSAVSPTFDLCFYWNYRLDGDALLAQLLGMGFAIEEIERCQVAMETSSRPLLSHTVIAFQQTHGALFKVSLHDILSFTQV